MSNLQVLEHLNSRKEKKKDINWNENNEIMHTFNET